MGLLGSLKKISVSSPKLVGLKVVDAVGGGDDVRSVDEGSAAEVDVVELLLLEDGNLPGVLG